MFNYFKSKKKLIAEKQELINLLESVEQDLELLKRTLVFVKNQNDRLARLLTEDDPNFERVTLN